MRWWLGAILVYAALVSSAVAFALSPQPRATIWGVVADTDMPLVWFNPSQPGEAAFTSKNGTLVQFGGSAYWIPVDVRSACGLGDAVLLAGSINGSPALVTAYPGNASALVIDVSGYFTAVSCANGLSAAGVAAGFISPPYHPIIVMNGTAVVLNGTVMLEPISVYGDHNSTYASFGANYYLTLNRSGAYQVYAPSYVEVYYSGPDLVAGELTTNASQWPFLTLKGKHVTYVMSSNGYVSVVQTDLNSWSVYLRPVAGWALLVYLGRYGWVTATSAVLDYTFSLTAAYPYMGGVEVTGVFYPRSGAEQIGLYMNGTANGYLEADGHVIGWASSERPATISPSVTQERTPFSLTAVKVLYHAVPMRQVDLRIRRGSPVRISPVTLNYTNYNGALSLSIDASLLATAIIIFVRRT